jgi:hypothetical protein
VYETLQFLCPVIAFPFPFCTGQPGKREDYLILFTGVIHDSECQKVVPYGIFPRFNLPDSRQKELLGRNNIFFAIDKDNTPGSKSCIQRDGFEFNILRF